MVKLIGLLFMIVANVSIADVMTKKFNTLSDYQWHHRVVLSQTESREALLALQQQLVSLWDDIEDRKLAVIVLTKGDNLSTNPHWHAVRLTRTQLIELPLSPPIMMQSLSQNHTVLIGLDGGSKAAYDFFDSKQIFADIDKMPMRIQKKPQR